MDKVKQIFSSDSDKRTSTGGATSSGTGQSSGLTTSHQARARSQDPRSSLEGTSNGGAATTGSPVARTTGNSSNSATGTTGTGATTTGAGSHVQEDPTFSSHVHNIKQHHELPGEGVGSQTHDHKHLAAVTKDHHHTHETEEIQRVREHDKHIHHVQHHVQPLKDEHHHDREHVTHSHPQTHIQEQHVNAPEDTHLLGKLTTHHKDSTTDHGATRTIVDKGETVTENVHHHVHHLVQPVVERDQHHHKTIHTTIPVKHTTHEAPIIHQSSTHEPMHVKDFVAQGGDLKSTLTGHSAGVLADGKCERSVDGPAEELAKKLHLGSGSTSAQQSATTA